MTIAASGELFRISMGELLFTDGVAECLMLALLQRFATEGGRNRGTSWTFPALPNAIPGRPGCSEHGGTPLQRNVRLAMLAAINGSVGQIVRRVAVRKSSVHGRGVFALRTIAADQRIFEYRGEVTSWQRASARHRRSGMPGHTFIFGLADGRVIDGSVGGNSARWLNHSCQPNCEAIKEERGRIFIETLRNVMPGDELCIAYGLTIDEAITPDLAADYSCRCGTKRCTGSMLAAANG